MSAYFEEFSTARDCFAKAIEVAEGLQAKNTQLWEVLKAAQEENARLRQELFTTHNKATTTYNLRKHIEWLEAKLLDRERRLKAIQESMSTSFDTGQRVYEIILNACDLTKPLEGE